jgi:hypothetical protein
MPFASFMEVPVNLGEVCRVNCGIIRPGRPFRENPLAGRGGEVDAVT